MCDLNFIACMSELKHEDMDWRRERKGRRRKGCSRVLGGWGGVFFMIVDDSFLYVITCSINKQEKPIVPVLQLKIATMCVTLQTETREKHKSKRVSLLPLFHSHCHVCFPVFLSHSLFHFFPACRHITHCRGLRDRLAPQLQRCPCG